MMTDEQFLTEFVAALILLTALFGAAVFFLWKQVQEFEQDVEENLQTKSCNEKIEPSLYIIQYPLGFDLDDLIEPANGICRTTPESTVVVLPDCVSVVRVRSGEQPVTVIAAGSGERGVQCRR